MAKKKITKIQEGVIFTIEKVVYSSEDGTKISKPQSRKFSNRQVDGMRNYLLDLGYTIHKEEPYYVGE